MYWYRLQMKWDYKQIINPKIRRCIVCSNENILK
jgi:hypothetical protein